MIYNLTMHKQQIPDVEESPRLKPVADQTNYAELKAAVREAVRGIPAGSTVLVGGLGQLQALITDLQMFNVVFANFNPQTKRVEGIVKHDTWTRQERFEIENA